MEDKNGSDVVRFMWTVGVLGNRNILFASHQENSFNLLDVKTEDEEIKKVLRITLDEVTQKKKRELDTQKK